MNTVQWKPWDLPTEGPPCARLHCLHWKPQFKYMPGGESDGIQCCHAEQQFQDFSCYRTRASTSRGS